MTYIDKIIRYIKQNIVSIAIKEVDNLRKPFNISTSKFNRDFKSSTGFTPRDHLVAMKVDLAHRYKSEDPVLTIKEVVQKIGWDLTERQFTEVFKAHYAMTFGGNPISGHKVFSKTEIDTEYEFLFSKEMEALEEIIFRMVLLSGQDEYTIQDQGELSRTIVSKIGNTCFRFPYLTFEKEIIFSIFFDPDTPDHLKLLTVFTRIGAPDQCFGPTDKGIYLDLIYNVAINQEKSMEKAILESIINWDEMTNTEGNITFDGYQQRIYNKHIQPIINKDAGLFKYSQVRYDSIIKEFRDEYEELLNNMNIRQSDLSKYILALKEEDIHTIKSTLGVLVGIGTVDLLPEKLDLFLQLTEYPFIGHIQLKNYSLGIDKSLISKAIEKVPPALIPELVYDYFCAYKDVEDDGSYHGNEILSSILTLFTLSSSLTPSSL